MQVRLGRAVRTSGVGKQAADAEGASRPGFQYFLHSGTVRLGSPILANTAGS
jgi:hypothetical protein